MIFKCPTTGTTYGVRKFPIRRCVCGKAHTAADSARLTWRERWRWWWKSKLGRRLSLLLDALGVTQGRYIVCKTFALRAVGYKGKVGCGCGKREKALDKLEEALT
jgi:hypothetical protein